MCLLRSLSHFLGIGGLAIHIWTLVVAYQADASFLGLLLTFILPVLSEIYWVIKMFGVNDVYSWTVIAYTGLVVFMGLIHRGME